MNESELSHSRGAEAQAAAVAVLQRLFRWWCHGDQTEDLSDPFLGPFNDGVLPAARLPVWTGSVGQLGLLRLVADRGAAQGTRTAALKAYRACRGLPHEHEAQGLLLEQQHKWLMEQALRAVLLADWPADRDVLDHASDFVLTFKEKQVELMPAFLGFVSRLRRQAERGLGAEEELGSCWSLGFSFLDPLWSIRDELRVRWLSSGELFCLFRAGCQPREVLAVDGAAAEIGPWLRVAFEHGYVYSSYKYVELVGAVGAGDEGLGRLLAAGGAEPAVRLLDAALRRLLPTGPTGRVVWNGGTAAWDLLTPLAELLNPAVVDGPTALLRARLLQGHGLDSLLPYLRQVLLSDHYVNRHYDSAGVKDRIRLVLARYAAAIARGPALTRLTDRIAFH